jgi:CBS domain-containing protein
MPEESSWEDHYEFVGQYMTTDLFTVNQDEIIDMVASVMEWQHVRHVPVEDNDHRLVGLVTRRSIMKSLLENRSDDTSVPVSDIMLTADDIVTVSPTTTTLEAIKLMRQESISSLPVVEDGKLVGIVTERDFMNIARDLLEERLEARSRAKNGEDPEAARRKKADVVEASLSETSRVEVEEGGESDGTDSKAI